MNGTEPLSVFERVAALVPNAAPWWGGAVDYRGVVAPWADGTIVVTADDDHEWTVGVYPGDSWQTGAGVVVYGTARTAGEVVDLVRSLITLQPEGATWSEWAPRWLEDRIADGEYA